MWRKKEVKKEKEVQEDVKVEVNLLKELCGVDAKLYDFLTIHLVVNPSSGISEENLDVLIDEGEKSGNFTQAVDKAIFEGAQNPEERERYIKIIQSIASRIIQTTEREKEKVEKEGLSDRAASLGRKIENQKFMIERAGDIINVASKFYNERLVESGEGERRKVREAGKRQAEIAEQQITEKEKADREARKKEEKKMGREAKREAEKQDIQEEFAAAERSAAREANRVKAEQEEQQITEKERVEREARKKERGGN
jgi:hypothetical protein